MHTLTDPSEYPAPSSFPNGASASIVTSATTPGEAPEELAICGVRLCTCLVKRRFAGHNQAGKAKGHSPETSITVAEDL